MLLTNTKTMLNTSVVSFYENFNPIFKRLEDMVIKGIENFDHPTVN